MTNMLPEELAVERYEPMVRRLAKYLAATSRKWPGVEDQKQEGLLAVALLARKKGACPSPAEAFLAARSGIIDAWRTAYGRPCRGRRYETSRRIKYLGVTSESSIPVPSWRRQFRAVDAKLDAESLLELASEPGKKILRAYVMDELGTEQTARMLGIDASTVFSRVWQAKQYVVSAAAKKRKSRNE